MNVTYVQHMGSDLTVVNSARVSFGKHKEELDAADEKLIKYLAAHGHFTPFTHCTATVHVKCPVFVRSQLAKHTVGLSMNEISRRYVTDTPDFWAPEYGWRKAAENKKQGSSNELVEGVVEEECNANYAKALRACEQAYTFMVKAGVCPEQARAVLPQSMFTEYYWTGSLYAFARVFKLRAAPDAQLETAMVAAGISAIMSDLFPVSWKELTNA